MTDIKQFIEENDTFAKRGKPASIGLIRDLATVVGSRGDKNELVSLMETITSADRTAFRGAGHTASGQRKTPCPI